MPIGRTLPRRGIRPPAVSGGSLGYFFDDFARADQALDASPNWTLLIGTPGSFSVVSEAVNFTGSASSVPTTIAAPDTYAADHFLEFTIGATPINVASLGMVVIRASADGVCVGMRQTGSQIDIIERRSTGVYSSIGNIIGAPVVGDVIRMWAVGSTFSMTKNGGSLVTATTQALTGTRAGFHLRTAGNLATRYDNFRCGPGAG